VTDNTTILVGLAAAAGALLYANRRASSRGRTAAWAPNVAPDERLVSTDVPGWTERRTGGGARVANADMRREARRLQTALNRFLFLARQGVVEYAATGLPASVRNDAARLVRYAPPAGMPFSELRVDGDAGARTRNSYDLARAFIRQIGGPGGVRYGVVLPGLDWRAVDQQTQTGLDNVAAGAAALARINVRLTDTLAFRQLLGSRIAGDRAAYIRSRANA